jgi:hypothetical protein
MGVIVPLFLILELKKKKLLQSLEKRLCCGIKDWGILEKRDFDDPSGYWWPPTYSTNSKWFHILAVFYGFSGPKRPGTF